MDSEKNLAENEENSMRSLYQEQIDRFKDRLMEAIGDESVRSFSKRCGISESVIRKYLADSYPNVDKLPRIAEATGRSIEWLLTGTECNSEEKVISFNEEFALIPGYRIQVSAGHGSLNPDQLEPTRHLAFRRKWLKYRGFKEKDLAIVWAKGDSMEPTIHNNDTLVVNMERKKPSDGHIYIFRNGDELFVKRYQSMLGTWRLISDNSFYSDLDIPKEEQHQFEVVGQVVHIAKDLGD
ncbi:XRE family transcriptional regulator [Enterovibrio nigricans]|uniref:Phage repressor protein C, contains Cro/C1-type HTH and peptisase s24 domains n=1 Tax=Enterovibrio nigricans DSM 22720 TaxID=1121868 RepID=A0A1T4V423_9GAMM|nr:S24 family peptidase [Enterovibrio nigricans]SKA59678.1 Phage repressor protein C, contains Cro/C1-type HTH and peptisase s24 domains [Enterovibrio nigricans DSM 22720]